MKFALDSVLCGVVHYIHTSEIGGLTSPRKENIVFQIDLKSRKSIYQQVVDKLKEMIIKGELHADDKLPSVRDFSKTLLINPNTVSKAYKELEREGYIYTTNGLGTYVAEQSSVKPDKKRVGEIKTQLSFYINELFYAGLSEAEIDKLVQEIIKKRGGNK